LARAAVSPARVRVRDGLNADGVSVTPLQHCPMLGIAMPGMHQGTRFRGGFRNFDLAANLQRQTSAQSVEKSGVIAHRNICLRIHGFRYTGSGRRDHRRTRQAAIAIRPRSPRNGSRYGRGLNAISTLPGCPPYSP
jgi:hypothetical protein